MPSLADIRIRDPFVLPVPEEAGYYLFGTTDANVWSGSPTGFDCYRSADLVTWSGPVPAFRPPAGFWGNTQFWAPEVHRWDGGWFMFATFAGVGHSRGTQILVSERPAGPYRPWSTGPVTPPGWECLDGTLHIDAAGDPWIVFCREWVQIIDGRIYAQRLTRDLRRAVGDPIMLVTASSAPWTVPVTGLGGTGFVTDGPYLWRTADGTLLLLWSSQSRDGYAMGTARSTNGAVTGPWMHDERPLWDHDGGHGMIFTAFDGRVVLAFHRPNSSPHERAELHPLTDGGGSLRLTPADPTTRG